MKSSTSRELLGVSLCTVSIPARGKELTWKDSRGPCTFDNRREVYVKVNRRKPN